MEFSRQRPAGITIERCQDWQKLSQLFHRYRAKDSVTTDRSPEFLEWRYGRTSDTYPAGVYLFHDRRGNEGWFSLGSALRGRWGHVSASVVLDAVLPVERISFRQILPDIVHLLAGTSDLLSLRPRPWLHERELSRWVMRRRSAVPAGFCIVRNRNSDLTAALDLSFADGDGALPIAPLLRSEKANRQAGMALC